MSTLTLVASVASQKISGQGINVSATLTMSGANYLMENQTLASGVDELLTVGDVTGASSLVLLHNQSDTYNVSVKQGTGGPVVCTLKPGQWSLWFSSATPDLYVAGVAGIANLSKMLFENVAVTTMNVYPSVITGTAGTSESTIRLEGIIGEVTITFLKTFNETVLIGSNRDGLAVGTDGADRAHDVTNLTGFTTVNSLVMVNTDASSSTLYGSPAKAAGFALIPGTAGFAFVPQNAATTVYHATSFAHSVMSLITGA